MTGFGEKVAAWQAELDKHYAMVRSLPPELKAGMDALLDQALTEGMTSNQFAQAANALFSRFAQPLQRFAAACQQGNDRLSEHRG